MANEQVLSLLIKVAKQGDGDQQAIQSLKQLHEQSRAAGGSLEQFGGASRHTSESVHLLREATGRHVIQLLQLRGVSPEIVEAFHGIRFAAGSAAGGFNLATIGTIGLAAAVPFLIEQTRELAKTLEEAGAQEIESSVQANEAQERRRKTLEKLGLSAKATKAEIQAFIQTQVDALKNLDALQKARDSGIKELDQRSQIGRVVDAIPGRLQTLQIQRQGIGANAFGQIDNQAAQGFSELDSKQEAARQKTASLLEKQVFLENTLKQQRLELARIPQGSKEFEERNKELERTKELLADVVFQTRLAATEERALKLESAEQAKLIAARATFEKQQKQESKNEKQLSIQQEFRSALEEQFTLEAKLKGVEDDRVAKAIAYLSASGRSVDAQRLLTLELEKQNKAAATPLQQAGRQIAQQRGINVDAIASRGQTLEERSQLRNLGGDFQRDFQAEERRLRRGPNRDEAFIQNQLASFSEQRLQQSPTLTRNLGITEPGQKSPTDTEKESLLKAVDVGRAKDAASKDLQQLAKTQVEFQKEFGVFAKVSGDSYKGLVQQVKVLADTIKNQK